MKRNNHWLSVAMQQWRADGVIMLAPDEDGDHDGNYTPGTCWAIIHECYPHRPVYARLDSGETVEDLKKSIEDARPGARVLLPTASSSPNNQAQPPRP